MLEKPEPAEAREVSSADAASAQASPMRPEWKQASRRSGAGSTADDAPRLDKVDDASDDSFPASDAPAWTGTHIGVPRSDR